MLCLTPHWPKQNQLWLHPLYGARTLQNIAEMDALPRPKPAPPAHEPVESEYMSIRRERFIDQHGFSL